MHLERDTKKSFRISESKYTTKYHAAETYGKDQSFSLVDFLSSAESVEDWVEVDAEDGLDVWEVERQVSDRRDVVHVKTNAELSNR